MFALERAFAPSHLPFPTFSFAPTLTSSDLPFPWPESFRAEAQLHMQASVASNFSDAFYHRHHTPWSQRDPRAALFASFDSPRQVVFDAAALRPDLLDVSFSSADMYPWNPLSDEAPIIGKWGQNLSAEFRSALRNHPGFLQPILRFSDKRRYEPHNYKYVIVPSGFRDQSTSDRLARLFAHSGAVVMMMQTTQFVYHFCARLQPWVHCVPLVHNMADVISKMNPARVFFAFRRAD